MAMEKLSDRELVGRLKQLAGAERALLGEVLRLLREVEDRRIPESTENPTLFKFCVAVLGFSECTAYPRIQVVRLMQVVPEVVTDIEAGRLTMTIASCAQGHFRRQKQKKAPVPELRQREILKSLHGLPTRQAEKALADLFPEAPTRQHTKRLGNGKVKVSFAVSEDLFEDVQELFRIRSHTNPEKRWEKLLLDLVKLGWKKWHPLRACKKPHSAHYEADGHEENQRDRAH